MSRSLLYLALRLLGLAVGILVLGLNVWLLCVCETRQGMVFAVAGMALGLAFFLAAVAARWHRKLLGWGAGIMLLVWVSLTVWLGVQAPNGQTALLARVQNRYSDGQWHFRPFPLGNLLPEIDQFRFGFQLVPFIDPLFNRKQAHTLTKLTSDLYRELEKDPDFHALGSVMPDAYDEIWGQSFDRGHYFLCLPRTLDRTKPAPVLIFLHGSGGNFKAYTWLLSQVADELGMVIIAPTYGMGNWRQQDTGRVVDAALDDAAKVVSINRDQVHLMGLSNGGKGACQAALALGKQLRSVSFLSPVFDLHIVGSEDLATKWTGRPVLVITGDQDNRVPHDYVASAVDTLQRDNINVAFKTVATADHFMLFSHRKEVIRLILNWLRPQLEVVLPPQT